MGIVLFTACSGFLGRSWTMVLDRPTRLATELLDWMSCSFSSWQGEGGWAGCSRMGRGGLSRASRLSPHPSAGLQGLSKHVRRVLLPWQDGKRAQEMGWEGGRTSPLLPLPCKATCTPLALWLVGPENVFF